MIDGSVRRVLVTGGAGFIGSHLVECLVASGCRVKVLDNLSTGKLENIRGHLKSEKAVFVEGDVRDASIVERCVQDCDAVVHLAGLTSVPYSVKHPEETFDVNVEGTLNVLRSCAEWRISKLLFASSSAVYGEPQSLPASEETGVNPISPYAESKLAAEHYCLGFNDVQLLPSVVLRLFNVYGPRQALSEYSGVITKFLDWAEKGTPLLVYGDGSQTRDFIYVSDVVQAVLTLLQNDRMTGVFNIGCGEAISVQDLAKKIIELSGKDVGVVHKPPRKGDIPHSVADISKAQKTFGFSPQVSLEKGLQSLLHWREDSKN